MRQIFRFFLLQEILPTHISVRWSSPSSPKYVPNVNTGSKLWKWCEDAMWNLLGHKLWEPLIFELFMKRGWVHVFHSTVQTQKPLLGISLQINFCRYYWLQLWKHLASWVEIEYSSWGLFLFTTTSSISLHPEPAWRICNCGRKKRGVDPKNFDKNFTWGISVEKQEIVRLDFRNVRGASALGILSICSGAFQAFIVSDLS